MNIITTNDMLITEHKEQHTYKQIEGYTAQISCYNSTVYAEILLKDKIYARYDSNGWFAVMHKTFNSGWFRNTPKEEDFKKAREWVDIQLNKLERNTTVLVTQPGWVIDQANRPLSIIERYK